MYDILTDVFSISITINNTLHVVVVDLLFAPRDVILIMRMITHGLNIAYGLWLGYCSSM